MKGNLVPIGALPERFCRICQAPLDPFGPFPCKHAVWSQARKRWEVPSRV